MVNKDDFKIKKGDCLLEEEPFAYVLINKYRTERCDYCLEQTKVFKCAGCQYVAYCGKKCQKASWLLHKYECPMLKKIYPRVVPDAAKMLCRLIIKLNHGGDLVRRYYTKTESRRFIDLMSHSKEIKDDPKRMEHLDSLYNVLSDMMDSLDLLPNKSELVSIYGRLVTNGFNILDPEMNCLATAIYLGVSVTDHSCNPNAVATFEGTRLRIHALENMAKLDWSKIFISYIELLSSAEERKQNLRQNYYFECQCSRCCDGEEEKMSNAACCPNKNCREQVLIEYDVCPKCRSPISKAYRSKFNEAVEFTKLKLQDMREIAYLDVCKICLAKQKNLLHNLNLWHVKTLDLAFEAAIEMQKWSEAVEFGEKLLPGFKRYYGFLNPLVGILHMKLGKIQLLLGQCLDASNNFEKAREILKITHGADHSLIHIQLAPLLIQARLESKIIKT